jgi:hypothetical protein
MPTKHLIPRFKSEEEEAAWWDAHPEVITELFLRAKKAGMIKRLAPAHGVTRPVTIRLPVQTSRQRRRLRSDAAFRTRPIARVCCTRLQREKKAS